VRRGARVRGPEIETGGMLLGSFDEATGVATVDLATGPAPDSRLSSTYFLNGVEGTQDSLDAASDASRGLTRFLGLWHSHPYGPARPSETDQAGITAITSFTPGARRALMVILGGPELWDEWVAGDAPGPHLYARILDAPSTSPSSTSRTSQRARGEAELTPYQQMLQTPPPGVYYEGGYSGAVVTDAEQPRPQLSGLQRALRAVGLPGAK
jgi:integrative and conjugative element protein (TIGR02256 family)